MAVLIDDMKQLAAEQKLGNLASPAYDVGAEEAELRRQWLDYFTKLQSRFTKGHWQ